MTTRTTPTLGAVIKAAIEARLAGLWVALPARVESYDPATQRCSAQPVSLQGYVDETGERRTTRLPVVADVPVAWPRGGGFRATFPLASGDYVLLLFTSLAFEAWALGGGVNLDSGDDRRNTLSDAIAVAGIADFGHPLSSPPTDGGSFGQDGGPVVDVTSDTAFVGGRTGAEPTLKATSFLSALDTLIAAIASAVSPIAGGGDTAATAITTAKGIFDTAAAATKTTIAKVV